MKRFLYTCISIIVIIFIYEISYYRLGFFIDFHPNKEIENFVESEGKNIYIKEGNEFKNFEIKGVDLGSGIPGKFATDYAIDKDTYIRWFKQIQEMGANTIRIYTILNDDFYDAFYEYNQNNEKPLYLIQGMWVDDYIQFSGRDAFDKDFRGKMLEDSKKIVDIIHGRKKISMNDKYGNGIYKKDISKWTIGFILGVEWEDVTVEYTNRMYENYNKYEGKYMYTTENATAFEAILAEVGDKIIEYESSKYKNQRLVAFSNWPTTDPFDYQEDIENYFRKITKVNVENIKLTELVKSGTFASYHVYPYYPDYLNYADDKNQYIDYEGKINTYYAYVKKLVDFHTIPVVISEFGIPSSRGRTQIDRNTNRNQGGMSEVEQGQALIDCYNDLKKAGVSGTIIFTWQDEWFKRTWNTMNAVDLTKTPFWSDYQTNEQYFGLLSFDPGNEKSISYVDGDISEWKDEDVVVRNEDSSISMKYDEKFIYLMVYKENYQEDEKIYIPIDITPKTGSNYCSNYDIKFENDADFLIIIDGKENSKIQVQERYEILRAMSYREMYDISPYKDIPDKNTSLFKNINLLLITISNIKQNTQEKKESEVYETGKLTYGNANPDADDFNSLADFNIKDDNIEIKVPWGMLNFSNPSEMMIHDDYYENYGVEQIHIDKIYIGVGTEENKNERIQMKEKEVNGWGNNITYHERLKKSYYMIKELWNK